MTTRFSTNCPENPDPPNKGREWVQFDQDMLVSLFIGGADLHKLCLTLGRTKLGVLEMLVRKRLLTRTSVGGYNYDYHLTAMAAGLIRQRKAADRKAAGGDSSTSDPFSEAIPAYINEVNSTQEPTMSNANIETKTFIGGIDAKDMTDAEIFKRMAKIETDIDSLRKIKTASKKLAATIEAMEADVQALAAYVDNRE